MDNCVRLAMEANRKYVQDGLDRRRLEGELDAFEDDMIRRCNEKHYDVCLQIQADEDVNRVRELSKSRIAERAERREKAKQTRKDITLACLIFFAFAFVMYELAKWTPVPMCISVLYIILGVLFLVTYIRDPRFFLTD